MKKEEAKTADEGKKNDNDTRNWILKTIWHDKIEVEKYAKSYDEKPWYKTSRFIAPILYFLLTVSTHLFFSKEEFGVLEIIGVAAVMTPFIYLSTKGYRSAMALIILFIIIDFIAALLVFPVRPRIAPIIVRFLIYGTIAGELITSIRVENYLIKHHLRKKKKTLKDFIIGFSPIVILPVGFFIYGLIVGVNEGKRNAEVNKVAVSTVETEKRIQAMNENEMKSETEEKNQIMKSLDDAERALNEMSEFMEDLCFAFWKTNDISSDAAVILCKCEKDMHDKETSGNDILFLMDNVERFDFLLYKKDKDAIRIMEHIKTIRQYCIEAEKDKLSKIQVANQ